MRTGKAGDMTMKRERFVADAKLDPGRFYRNPSDIIRDRRLTNEERLDILTAWEQVTRRELNTGDDRTGADERLIQLQKLREELEQSREAAGAARERN